MRSLVYQIKNNVVWLVPGGVILLSLGHHIFNIWERKAFWVFLTFSLISPLIAWLFSKLFPIFYKTFLSFKKRKLLYIISALIMSCFVSWQVNKAPITYQTLTLEPKLLQNQQVVLAEIRVDKKNLQIMAKAIKMGWSESEGHLKATHDSLPLNYSFPVTTNGPVKILMNTSPTSGEILITYGNEKIKVDLQSPSVQPVIVRFNSNYRFIPGWLMISFIWVVDIFTCFVLIMAVFLFQRKGQHYLQEGREEKFLSHRCGLLVLIAVTSLLHLFSALSIPLILDSDSGSYLQGAAHLVQYGNLDGVHMTRGPGSTLLFAPVILLFGRNPFGMKLLLHILASGCVLIAYRIGWQLTRKRWIAFVIGFITMLLPDLYIYSNLAYSDVPNIFLVVLYVSLLLDAFNNSRFLRLLIVMLVGCFASLLRPENIVMMFIGFFILGIQPLWNLLRAFQLWKRNISVSKYYLFLVKLLGSFLLAMIPLILWSFHNLAINGFFGLSNYSSEVFYDGWVYYGKASDLDIVAKDSPAVKSIQLAIEQYPINITDHSGVATGWEIYPSLIKAGYTTQQAFDLFFQATRDSLVSHKYLIPKILQFKIEDLVSPEIVHQQTYPLVGEKVVTRQFDGIYFDPDTINIPILIQVQRMYYFVFNDFLANIYRLFVIYALVMMIFSLYFSPFRAWAFIVLVTASRIFISNLFGLSHWRYTLAGIVLLVVIAIIGTVFTLYGIKGVFINSSVSCEESST
jgi:hypothetical protein